MNSTVLIRINKYLSQTGRCSRREADKLIEQQRVRINNKVAVVGDKITEKDQIYVDGEELIKNSKNQRIYLAFNKPRGIVCTTDKKREKDNIIDYINFPTRIFPIGRLDKLSEGLIFLTNDGDIVNKILRARNNHEKEYEVEVNKPISSSFIKNLANGVPVLNTVTKKCFVKQLHKKKFKIVLTQGLNRQIRRMCEYLDYQVVNLRRVRIMNIRLDIKIGEYRYLSNQELAKLKSMLKGSKMINN